MELFEVLIHPMSRLIRLRKPALALKVAVAEVLNARIHE
jgi:hypothetical protein